MFLVCHKDLHYTNRSFYVGKLFEVKVLPRDTSNCCPKNLILFELLKVLYSKMQLEANEIAVCFSTLTMLSVLSSVLLLCEYLYESEVNIRKYQISPSDQEWTE